MLQFFAYPGLRFSIRWISFRTNAIGAIFASSVAAWLIYGKVVSAGTIGFTLSVIGAFSGGLLDAMRNINEVEVQANR